MKERKPHHPLVKLVLNLAKKDPMHENMGFDEFSEYTLSDDAKTQIQEEFKKYYDTDGLKEAVMELLRLILVFESKKSVDVMEFLAEIIVDAEEELKKQQVDDKSK